MIAALEVIEARFSVVGQRVPDGVIGEAVAVVGSQKIRPVRIVVGVGVRHGLAGDYFAAEVEIRGHAAQVAGRVVVVVELQPVVGGRFRVFLLRQLCTGKQRLLSPKGVACH